MAVQVSWPGVYIDEFEPGAPIQGVGTSTPVFIGIAEKGPRDTATRVFSWDEFVAKFGGLLDEPGAWLAQGVYGFFANGGTNCYVVRASTAETGKIALRARGVGNGHLLIATAVDEGPEGNGIAATVTDTSRSTEAVSRATRRTITAMADRKTLKVKGDVVGYFQVGDSVRVAKGTESQTATVATVTTPDQLVLAADLTGATNFTDGSVDNVTVRILFETQKIKTVSLDRTTVTLDAATHRFQVGDPVLATKGAASAETVVIGVAAAALTVSPPLGAGDFADGALQSNKLAKDSRRLRLAAPRGVNLTPTFPRGSLLRVTPNGGAEFFVRVLKAGGDEVQLDPPGIPTETPLSAQNTAPTVATADFDLALKTPSELTPTTFSFLSMDERSPGYWGKAVDSTAVTLSLADPTGAPTVAGDDRPMAETRTTTGGVSDNRASSWQKLTTTPAQYLNPLDRLRDVSLIAVPGGIEPSVQQALIAHCEGLKDRFAALDAAPELDITGVMEQFGQVRSADGGYAALYYPWIQVRHPSSGALQLWPPSGHILGVYARTDAERGVHKAPANTNIRGALGVEKVLSDTEQGPLNLLGVNVLRVFPGQSQPQVWGARTTAGDLNTNWLYINVRRLFIYLEQSLERGIRWAVFEPNDLSLWQKLKRSISDFLTQAWRDGALFGAKPEDAFYVRIDEALNPPASRALGRLYIEVGVVPTYPAEFIVLRIGIWDGGSEITTS